MQTTVKATSGDYIKFFTIKSKDNPELLQAIEQFVQGKTGMGLVAYQNNGANEDEKLELYGRIVAAINDGDLSMLDPNAEEAPSIEDEQPVQEDGQEEAEPEEPKADPDSDDIAAKLAALIRKMIHQPKPAKSEPELSRDAIAKLVRETARFEIEVMLKKIVDAVSQIITGQDEEENAGQ